MFALFENFLNPCWWSLFFNMLLPIFGIGEYLIKDAVKGADDIMWAKWILSGVILVIFIVMSVLSSTNIQHFWQVFTFRPKEMKKQSTTEKVLVWISAVCGWLLSLCITIGIAMSIISLVRNCPVPSSIGGIMYTGEQMMGGNPGEFYYDPYEGGFDPREL